MYCTEVAHIFRLQLERERHVSGVHDLAIAFPLGLASATRPNHVLMGQNKDILDVTTGGPESVYGTMVVLACRTSQERRWSGPVRTVSPAVIPWAAIRKTCDALMVDPEDVVFWWPVDQLLVDVHAPQAKLMLGETPHHDRIGIWFPVVSSGPAMVVPLM